MACQYGVNTAEAGLAPLFTRGYETLLFEWVNPVNSLKNEIVIIYSPFTNLSGAGFHNPG